MDWTDLDEAIIGPSGTPRARGAAFVAKAEIRLDNTHCGTRLPDPASHGNIVPSRLRDVEARRRTKSGRRSTSALKIRGVRDGEESHLKAHDIQNLAARLGP